MVLCITSSCQVILQTTLHKQSWHKHQYNNTYILISIYYYSYIDQCLNYIMLSKQLTILIINIVITLCNNDIVLL